MIFFFFVIVPDWDMLQLKNKQVTKGKSFLLYRFCSIPIVISFDQPFRY